MYMLFSMISVDHNNYSIIFISVDGVYSVHLLISICTFFSITGIYLLCCFNKAGISDVLRGLKGD